MTMAGWGKPGASGLGCMQDPISKLPAQVTAIAKLGASGKQLGRVPLRGVNPETRMP